MAKYYTEDGDEVEAFTQKEVDAKVAEASKGDGEIQKSLDAKTAEFDKLTKLHEDKSNSYTELLKKSKEFEEAEKTRKEEIEDTYAKSLDEQVKKIAGDDKEYAKALKKQLEREGIKEVTNDAEKLARQVKEAKALTDIELSREPSANPIDGGGSAPTGSVDGKNFTETSDGKATYDALASMMGLPSEEGAK